MMMLVKFYKKVKIYLDIVNRFTLLAFFKIIEKSNQEFQLELDKMQNILIFLC